MYKYYVIIYCMDSGSFEQVLNIRRIPFSLLYRSSLHPLHIVWTSTNSREMKYNLPKSHPVLMPLFMGKIKPSSLGRPHLCVHLWWVTIFERQTNKGDNTLDHVEIYARWTVDIYIHVFHKIDKYNLYKASFQA